MNEVFQFVSKFDFDNVICSFGWSASFCRIYVVFCYLGVWFCKLQNCVLAIGKNCNLSKTRRRGRNAVGQRGGNITMCAAISQNGVLHHHATLGPYNTDNIIQFQLFMTCLFRVCKMKTRQDLSSSGIMSGFIMPIRSKTGLLFFPLFLLSTCLHIHRVINPIEEFFSTWRWKVGYAIQEGSFHSVWQERI